MSYYDENDVLLLDFRGIEVYETDIELLCDEYINSLADGSMIYKSAVFIGLLEFIYKRLLKNIIPKDENKIDFILLDNIFYGIFIPICFKYNITPTLILFSSFIHVNNNYLYDIKNGYKGNRKINKIDVDIVKKWSDFIESGLLLKTVNEQSIGAMFALKTKYQYREASTITIDNGSMIAHESPDEIAARHSNAQLPTKPDL